VLTPEIFTLLENTPPGYAGEIQLTDGLRALCKISPMVAVDFNARRYDTGNLKGFLEATIDFALRDRAVGPWLEKFLIEKVKSM
jgi:UTP--glucose-1-phosphate uridylyltransferase